MIISTHKGKKKILPSHLPQQKHLGLLEGERKIFKKKTLLAASDFSYLSKGSTPQDC